jgi:hypothetical protein
VSLCVFCAPFQKQLKRIALVFSPLPVIAVQLIGAAYFQAGLKGVITNLVNKAFLNSISIHTTEFFGIFGVWIAFPADVLSTLLTGYFLKEMTTKLIQTTDGLL